MKVQLLACFAVCASAVVADSQTNGVAAGEVNAPAAQAEAVTDEIDLAADADGKVDLTLSGKGADKLVNIICEDAPIADVLSQFRKVVRANIISPDSTNLNRRVSISLYDAPWLDSMKAVLGMGGFALDERNGIYFVTEEQTESPVVRTKAFTLNHAGADDLAKMLNESFGEKDPKTGKSVGNVASVFKDANVVVVKGTDKLIRECEEVISSVDKAPPQVYIEARFMTLSATAMHKLGVQWNQLQNWGATLKGMEAGYENNSGRAANYGTRQTQRTVNRNTNVSENENSSKQPGSSSVIEGTPVTSEGGESSSKSRNSNTTESDNGTFTTLTPSAIAEAIGAGRSADSMGWAHAGGFSGQLSVDDFRLALSAFEQFGEGKLFSNPKIIVSNGKQAKVDMTTKFPNVAVTASRSGNVSDSLDISTRLEVIPGEDKEMFAKEAFYSWGISLSVTPRISPDGLINVEIVPTISELDKSDGGDGFYHIGGGSTDMPYSQFPKIAIKRLTTDFTMRDGATAVIGGLSQTSEDDIDSGIPYLRSIPWIGPKLFGWKSREKVQNEIIVFVTVGIANPNSLPKDVGLPKNAILGRDYVRGDKLEPGDRAGTSTEIMALDMRTLDERAKDAKKDGKEPTGPAKDDRPAEPAAVPPATGPAKDPADAAGPMKATEPPAADAASSGPTKAVAPEATPAAEAEPARAIRHGRAK